MDIKNSTDQESELRMIKEQNSKSFFFEKMPPPKFSKASEPVPERQMTTLDLVNIPDVEYPMLMRWIRKLS